jgi:hypothetical protein
MEQNSSWEADYRSNCQEISSLVRSWKIHYCVHNGLPLDYNKDDDSDDGDDDGDDNSSLPRDCIEVFVETDNCPASCIWEWWNNKI